MIMQFPFFINSNTVILDNLNHPIRFADLKVDDLVEVHADRQADGRLLATRIKIENVPSDEIELTGAIESLDSDTLVVFRLKFTVDRNTLILDNHKNPIKLADLKAGLIVEIRALRQADGTLLAAKIKAEDRLNIFSCCTNRENAGHSQRSGNKLAREEQLAG